MKPKLERLDLALLFLPALALPVVSVTTPLSKQPEPQPASALVAGVCWEVVSTEYTSDIPEQVMATETVVAKSEETQTEPAPIPATPTPVPTMTPTPAPTAKPEVTPTPSPLEAPKPEIKAVSPAELEEVFTRMAEAFGADRDALVHISACESGHNPGSVNGPYGGMYQFSASTWQSTREAMGADPNPDLRFDAEQAIMTAAWKIAHGGIGAWPHCAQPFL